MKIITVATEKGGVGKTTLSAHLVWMLASLGFYVLAIDLDHQANLSMTLDGFVGDVDAQSLFSGVGISNPNGVQIMLAQATHAIASLDRADEESIEAFRRAVFGTTGFDVCVIDTPPAIHNLRTIAALSVSDAVISPIELSDYALAGAERLHALINQIPVDFRRKPIDWMGLLPWKYHSSSPRETYLLKTLEETLSGMMFPGKVKKRDAFARSSTEKVPVWELPGTAPREASAEVRPVLRDIIERLKIDKSR